MKIRSAEAEDAEVLAQAEYSTSLENEGLLAARPFEISVDAFREKIRALAEPGLYVVLETEQGKLAGHLILERLGLAATRHVAQLTIVVHPGFTGRGHGRRLMEYALAWARQSPDIEKIELRVRSTNPRAIHLYESLGFHTEGRLRDRLRLSEGYADDLCMGLFVRGA